jgi:hypothetical protein
VNRNGASVEMSKDEWHFVIGALTYLMTNVHHEEEDHVKWFARVIRKIESQIFDEEAFRRREEAKYLSPEERWGEIPF